MLKSLEKAPTDLGKQGEITKISPALDRMTKDIGDLRFYASNDGKRTYLRVWETSSVPNGQDQPHWFVVEEAPAAAPTDVTKKK